MGKNDNEKQQENLNGEQEPVDAATVQNKEQEQPATSAEEKENMENTVKTEDVVERPEQILEKEVAKLKEEHQDLKDKYLRLFAEFDNYKKRTLKEKVELMKTAAQDTMTSLLPVLDDFDRAKANAENENSTEVFSEGVKLVYEKLYSILQQQGLKPMETNGKAFDPDLHFAFTEIPAPSEDLKGKIVDTIEKGYFLKDKIIRHAKVVIGN